MIYKTQLEEYLKKLDYSYQLKIHFISVKQFYFYEKYIYLKIKTIVRSIIAELIRLSEL
jgi:hypothetical protein